MAKGERSYVQPEVVTQFESAIGAAPRHRAKRPSRELAGKTETVVISDLHVPLHRQDLLTEIVAEHRGKELVIAGDINDFEAIGKWESFRKTPSVDQCLAVADGVLQVLVNEFSRVTLMLGNHDLRLPKRAARDTHMGEFYQIGMDYLVEKILKPLEHRHGVEIVMNTVDDLAGGSHDYVHFYYQQGDALISHAETCGKPVAAGAVKANDWFKSWKQHLKLDDWRLFLQAHTHKLSYTRTDDDQHLFEIGCLCGIPAYTLKGQGSYGPPKPGYFLLTQYDGETCMRESRQVPLPLLPERG